MKKKFQKLLTFFMACMLMVSMMSIGASAETYETTGLDTERTNGRLTLTEYVQGKSSAYTAYRVLIAKVVEGQDTYEYALTDDFKSAGVTADEISKATGGSNNYVITGKLDEIAAKLENYVKTTPSITGTALTVGNQTELPIGYYLILETTTTAGFKQTKPMLVAIPGTGSNGKYEYDVTVTIKDQPITTTKTIEQSNAAQKDSIAQQVGKEFTFKIVQDVPKYDDTYKDVVFKVTDTMSKGLDFVEGSVQVKTKTGENEKNLDNGDYDLEIKDKTLIFDFSKNGQDTTKNYYKNVKDAEKVIITYKAKLNKDATFGPSGELNTVVPEFGENPGSTTTGTPDKAKAFAGGLKITKKGDGGALLEGAKFTVYTDEGCTEEAELVTYEVTTDDDGKTTITENRNPELSATATTDKDGVVRFEGLGEGTYYIKEVASPTGYIKLKNPIRVDVAVTLPDTITNGTETATFTYTISGDGITEGEVTVINNGIAEFEVKNTKGFTLPTTGGMGTYIFTIGGVLLIAAAVVLFIRLRKKAN